MPSDLIVEVCKIKEIMPHSGADKLELVIVKGWQTVAPIGVYKAGDKVLYIPPDAILTEEFSNKIGVTRYLSKQRVKAIRLRGEMSFGIVSPAGKYPEGKDLKKVLGITKYEPNVPRIRGEDKAWRNTLWGRVKHYWNIFFYRILFRKKYAPFPEHPCFHKYTDIQNIRNYPKMFKDGEEVICTEKVHGTNSRVGIVQAKEKKREPIICAGSHNKRRKIDKDDIYSHQLFLEGDNVRRMLVDLYEEREAESVILFSEIYGKHSEGGRAVQKNFTYGCSGTSFGAFDICVNGKHLDYDEFIEVCTKYDIPTMPVLYRGPFSREKIEEVAEGESVITETEQIREGVVVRPVTERYSLNYQRVVLKAISNEYLLKKDMTEYH